MSAEHIYKRAHEAATNVDSMVLANALDHIAKTAAKSRTSTRRLRWIEARAIGALEGRQYSDIDIDLPVDGGPATAAKLTRYLAAERSHTRELLEALTALIARYEFDGIPNDSLPVVAAARAARDRVAAAASQLGGPQ